MLSHAMTATVPSTTVALHTQAFARYGYSFGVERLGQALLIPHAGCALGVNAQLDLCPDRDCVVAALANGDPPAATPVARRV